MSINETAIKGKWLEIKGEIQKAWGKLTDDDLEKTKGDLKAIRGIIKQRYGNVEEKADEKLKSIYDKIIEKKDVAIDTLKKKLK
jgi:uncharacterized protein YjbJ (UPF0337 family)